jgi:hypothetical protein
MVGRIVIVGALALAGCNQVFGIRNTGLRDDDAAIAADMFMADVLPSNCTIMNGIESNGNTYLLGETNRGDLPEMVVGPNQPGLLRFPTGQSSSQEIAAAVLHLTRIDLCDSPTCDACPVVPAGTGYQLYWTRRDFDEKATTATKRTANNNWAAVNATGATDRSGLLATGTLRLDTVDHSELLVARMNDVTARPAFAWNSGVPQEIAIQVVTDSLVAFASDDSDASTCGIAPSPPRLDLTLCTP